jgi:indole-3-glycerol phosphate synthase
MTILERIILHKKKELEEARTKYPLKKLEKSVFFSRETRSLSKAVADPDKSGIIAEFKRKSPTHGMINEHALIEEVTTGYFRSGASGLSILTDQEFFGGTNDDLSRARELNPIPILRKDFIIDEYQILEARAIGADAILLIAAVITREQTKHLARFARSLELEVLLEVHREDELDRLNEFVNLVGVNNRDLSTFTVDTDRSVQLAGFIPQDFVKISESGITSPLVLKSLKGYGYQGFLIGESFMRHPEPAVAFSEFVKQLFFDHD